MRIGLVYDSIQFFTKKDEFPWDIESGFTGLSYANKILHAIEDEGFEVIVITSSKTLLERIKQYSKELDFVFNLSRGYTGGGRKSLVPLVLDAYSMPYLGSNAYVHELVRNKYHSKILAERAGIPTPEFMIIEDKKDLDTINPEIFPAIIKPCFESASIGISLDSVVTEKEALRKKTKSLLKAYNQPILIEKFISGKEITVPIIGNNPSKSFGIVGITIDGKFDLGDVFLYAEKTMEYDFGFKYPISSEPYCEQVEKFALKVYRFLGIRDFGRADFRVDKEGIPWFIEASTHPDIIPHSDFFTIAKFKKIPYNKLILKLLKTSFKRHNIQI